MPWITLNQKDGANEILMYEPIGRDPWSDEGLTAKDFKAVLDKVESGKDLTIRINSKGGDVYEGFTIRNLLDAWNGKVSVIIDGVAASTASWIGLGADEIKAAKNSQMFIHDAIAFGFGNAAELTKQAERLNITSDQIAQMYADKTGKPQSEMRDLMRKETLLTAEDAVKLGLIDGLTDSSAISNFSDADLNAMKARLRTMNQTTTAPSAGKPKEMHSMSDTKTGEQPAALNKLPDPPKPSAENKGTDAVVLDMLNAFKGELASLREENKSLREREDATRKQRIENAVDELVRNDQIVLAIRDSVINRAMKDETILDDYRKLAPKPPGAEPVKPMNIQGEVGLQDVTAMFNRCNEAMKAWQRGNDISPVILSRNAGEKAMFYQKHADRITQIMNVGSNTVPAGLQRQTILQAVIVDFARMLLPLNAFATNFGSVPLEGTNKVNVRYYDLDSSASTSWVAANGYAAGDTVTDTREIQIGSNGGNAALLCDRKYQGLSWTSEEIARQPYLKTLELAQQKVDKLASDIITHVLGVVTAANFGAAAITKTAALFDADQIAILKGVCKLWPRMGRSLIIDSDYDAYLLQDASIKSAMNYGGSEGIREGRIPKLFGFDYYELPTIPANNENLKGFAVFKSAILYAQAPVPPAQEVRNAGTTYEIATDPSTGITLEYRTFGDNTLDTAKHFIEASYGFAKGNGTALKRIVSQ